MDTSLFEQLVSIRRHLHQHPELSFTEFKTAEFVEQQLTGLAIPHQRIALTGVIGTLEKGDGPTIILRADMDALPITEDSGVAFPSKRDGVMHACGHDIHTTMLLGAAHLLHTKEFNGTVKFVFQPAEEGPMRSPEPGKSGAQLIMESGQLKGDAVLGLHVDPLLPVGTLSYRNGEALANVGNFSIRITGKGGHPGFMKEVIDPIAIAARLITAAHALVGPQPEVPVSVMAITYVSTETNPSFNVIPNQVLLQGSLRANRIADYNDIIGRLNALHRQLEAEYGCTIELDFSAYYPSLLNDETIHKKLAPVHQRIFGDANLTEGLAYLVGEDFSFYSRAIPGQFYFLGAKTDQNDRYFLHHPKVTFNEDCIKYGSSFLAESALRLMH
ncbi:MAG TPA: M20 family metallopeptidase [Puia sp.]|uniref:M20 metallopeptidase family protein n=1 Tax=Puia sp. TaxID=2045100 RepID=UPI002BF4E135|nr:M20 family metallopeptidase [Puia sp.]HVU98047.1 M20 family metallopeptidase [Puia sp.]